MMQTPIADFVRAYRDREMTRMHMPGHKGHVLLGPEPLDITEVAGADALFEAEGIILQSEENATRLFGTRHTFYSCEGSSLGVRAMLALAGMYASAKGKTGPVLAARNVHKSFVQACALLGLEAEFLYGQGDAVWMAPISPEEAKRQIDLVHPIALYVTSPDYLGQLTDIPALSRICKARGIPLLVDNAHGAYLHFLPQSLHPMDLGADLCCDSAHKTLPVLTGGAYLHVSKDADPFFAAHARSMLSLFASTSPSYLILQSLDLCNAALHKDFPAACAALSSVLKEIQARLDGAGIPLVGDEPFKVTLAANRLGLTGLASAAHFRSCGIEPEYADYSFMVLMISPENTQAELKQMEEAFLTLPKAAPLLPAPCALHPLPRALGIRAAVLSPHEQIPAEKAEGRICGLPTVSCPPAIPIAVSGERFDAETVHLLMSQGIEMVDVVSD